MTGERIGGWMQTYTGKAFWPMDARPEEIDPVDIAHSLAQQCRYAGHTRFPYSVAQHSCLISDAVSPRYALWGLLHDATEAYLVDLPRPVKYSPGMEAYSLAEARLEIVMAERFGLTLPMPAEVKDADTRILLDEKEALMATPPRDWALNVKPLGVNIHRWSPERAEDEWLDRFYDLTQEKAA